MSAQPFQVASQSPAGPARARERRAQCRAPAPLVPATRIVRAASPETSRLQSPRSPARSGVVSHQGHIRDLRRHPFVGTVVRSRAQSARRLRASSQLGPQGRATRNSLRESVRTEPAQRGAVQYPLYFVAGRGRRRSEAAPHHVIRDQVLFLLVGARGQEPMSCQSRGDLAAITAGTRATRTRDISARSGPVLVHLHHDPQPRSSARRASAR